jgi:hypothetical protein
MQDAIPAVEVVSPSSGLRDRETKRALYAETGIPSYWLAEPDEERPTIRLTEFALGPERPMSASSTGSPASSAPRLPGPWRSISPH